MSPSDPRPGGHVRAIAFASADGTAWGAAVSHGGPWSLVLGPAGAGDGVVDLTEEPDGGWRLERDDGALSLRALPDEPPSPPEVGGADGSTKPAALDNLSGGITPRQYDAIRKLPGVAVAAPLTVVLPPMIS